MSNLSEEEKKAIEFIKDWEYIELEDDKEYKEFEKDINIVFKLIEKQQKELDKKDKTMIKMARVIKSGGRLYGVRSSQGVIEYFTKQVEGE